MACAALIGWLCDIDFLKRLVGSTAINPISAICFTLLGLETARLLRQLNHPNAKLIGLVAVLVVLAVNTGKLGEVFFHTQMHLDKVLFAEKLSRETTPNQMAPNTAFCFAILSIITLMMRSASNRIVSAAQLLTIVPVSVGLTAVFG